MGIVEEVIVEIDAANPPFAADGGGRPFRLPLLPFANRPVLVRVIACSLPDRVSSTSCQSAS
jgi:hypothetical protein